MKNSKIEYWDIDKLIPYEKNAKKHPKEQIETIAESIKEMGFREGSAIQVTTDGTVVNGHGRRLAALKLGLKQVPVEILGDLNETQIKAFRIIDNKVAESSYDTDLLVEELRELHEEDFDLKTYFDEREWNFATEDLGEMDFDALADDLSEQVEQHQSKTEQALAKEKETTFPIKDALGYNTVNAEQKRSLLLLQNLAEGETNLTGAEALSAFADALFNRKQM